MIMLFEEVNAAFEMEGVDEETSNEINELAKVYYNKYKDKFIELVYRTEE